MATSVKKLDIAEDRVQRTAVRMWASVDYGDARENAVVRDLSASGFGIETTRDLCQGARIIVTVGGTRPFAATVVHRTPDRYGCQLETALTADQLDAMTRDGPFASAPPAAPTVPLPGIEEKLPYPLRAASILGAATICWSVVAAIGIAIVG
jgi:hypothetical protein